MPLNSVTPCLWFNGQAEEAAAFYVSIFENSRILETQRYLDVGREVHKSEPGSVMTITFELNGHQLMGLNGGTEFKLSPAVSFVIDCEDQAEVDYYWEKLGDGADEASMICGWVADKFGVSWQIVPKALRRMTGDSDKTKAGRAFAAMMKMKKIDVAELEKAFEG